RMGPPSIVLPCGEGEAPMLNTGTCVQKPCIGDIGIRGDGIATIAAMRSEPQTTTLAGTRAPEHRPNTDNAASQAAERHRHSASEPFIASTTSQPHSGPIVLTPAQSAMEKGHQAAHFCSRKRRHADPAESWPNRVDASSDERHGSGTASS